MKAPVPFLKGDKHGSETDYRDALPVNMYPIQREILGAQGYMIQAEGLTQYATGGGADRGGIWNERLESHFRVSGGSLISVSESGAVTALGSISGLDQAAMPYSFTTQGIVADGRFWRYNSSIGLAEVTDPDLGDPIDCVWIDGYYFFTDGEFIYHSDIANEASIDPLKFATAEFMPDPSLGVAKTTDNKVIVFGRYSTEYFVNVASQNFAFSRVPTRAVKAGIVGTHAKAEINDRWYILGGRKEDSPSVFMLGVGDVSKVATREVDKIIAGYTETALASSRLEARTIDGNAYLLVHLPNETLCYSETIAQKVGMTYAWAILNTGTDSLSWRGINGIYEPRKGVWVYGDKYGNQIGFLDRNAGTQYGEIAEWELYSPLLNLEQGSIDELSIETIPGFTSTSDAKVFISMTYDGVTYGKEWVQLYGSPNDYNKRFIVRRLGYVREIFGFKLRGATRSRMAFGMAMIDYG